MSTLEPTHDVEAELRSLAALAAPATRAPGNLSATVLRTARARRRHRHTIIAVVTGVGLVGSVAAVTVGGGPYFDVVQPSAAMAPGITVGESVTFNRDLAAHRGDVAYLKLSESGHDFTIISRVIGEPGDTVACPAATSGYCAALLVNGHASEDPYLDGLATRPFPPVTVPAGRLFVLGDNRAQANDSRFLGPVPAAAVQGVAVATKDQSGHPWAVPGAPRHHAPDDQNLIDPPLPAPPASTVQQ